MPSFLSDEWFDIVDELHHSAADVPTPGELSDLRVGLTVVGGPRGDQICHLAPAPGGLGVHDGPLHDAETHITLPFDTAVAMFVDHDISAAMKAFADGELVVSGDMSKLFALEQAGSDNPAAEELQSAVRAATAESTRGAEEPAVRVQPVADPSAYLRPGRSAPRDRHSAGPNVLLITTDQQRFDSLGVNGNSTCSTPVVDSLHREGLQFRRAHVQNVLCTPSRSTILTGQHPGTHGVWSNGVALPQDAPSVADVVAEAGYRTAHVGKQHFEPTNTLSAYLAAAGSDETWTGPYRGFDHVESADHFHAHGTYPIWLRGQLGDEGFRRHMDELFNCFRGTGGDTAAPQASYSSLPAGLHSSTWIADRAIDWIDSIGDDQSFFCWMSFDDPHHPFNPPEAYGRRHDWHDIGLPHGRPQGRDAIEKALAGKPWQYGAYWRGEFSQHEGAVDAHPASMTDNQLRELIGLTYGMIELIDENIGRVLAHLAATGRDRDTHIFFTSDHGELLGDHGLLFKGPFHVEALMHVALAWRRPGAEPGVVEDPVGLVDLGPTICAIAGVPVPEWMDGEPLPTSDGSRERVLTVFDSAYRPDLSLRTLYRDERVITAYPQQPGVGELYDLTEDPHQFVNLFDDPSRAGERDALLADLTEHVVEDARAERLRWWQHA